jgi:hypothetical protein
MQMPSPNGCEIVHGHGNVSDHAGHEVEGANAQRIPEPKFQGPPRILHPFRLGVLGFPLRLAVKPLGDKADGLPHCGAREKQHWRLQEQLRPSKSVPVTVPGRITDQQRRGARAYEKPPSDGGLANSLANTADWSEFSTGHCVGARTFELDTASISGVPSHYSQIDWRHPSRRADWKWRASGVCKELAGSSSCHIVD